MAPVDAAHFRQLLGRFATGVAVLATRDSSGGPVGMTVNTLTSVSLDPPLILVCVDRLHETHAALLTADHFVVSVLASDQEAISRRFATGDARFAGVGYQLTDRGVAVVDGALAHLECDVYERHPAGDHTVFFGRVVGGAVSERRPLLYYRSGYSSLSG